MALSLLSKISCKTAAYSAGQVAGMMDEGGAEDSIRNFGTLAGAAAGGAAGFAGALKGAIPGGSDLVQTGAGAGLGALAGRGLSALAIRGMKGLNKRYAVAEDITGIPRSKLEELPLSTRLHLLHHSGHEMKRREKAAVNISAKIASVQPQDFSASQLREYQMKHMEPRMRPLIDAIGTIGGGLAGGAEGMRLGHPVIGTLLGAGAGTLAAHEARKLTQRAIQKRYLTRRVIEQANKAPLSTQIKQLRYLPAGVVTGTEQIVQAPGQGPTLSLDRSPAVEPR